MKEKSSVKLTFNILQLQNLIKRDPPSYYDDFLKQYEHYKSLLELFKFNPNEYNENVADLVMFLSQVSSYYTEDLKDFPNEIINLLKEYASVLDPSMRLCLVKSLILMRNRGVLSPTDLLTLSFELLRCKDKVLRNLVQVHIVSDLKNINAKHKNLKVNSVIQSFMFKMLNDSNVTAAKVSLDIMIELYKRNVWRDAKSVNAIATACFSKVNKILVAAHQFFLGVDEDDEKEDSDSDDDNLPNVREVMQANKVNKKTRKREKELKRTKKLLKKSKKKKVKEAFDFSAIHLLHDPQGMAEKLLKSLQSMNERYEIKLLVMNLISRLVGVHELILLNFYPLLSRFLKPNQKEVTKILMFAAQAAHEHVPPDSLEPIVRAIAYNFITERNSSEAITVGINAIKEICARCPFAIDRDLLLDLVQYQKYKNKNVNMAARSLVQLFRKVNPKLLKRKDRSKPTESSKEAVPMEYGALNAMSYIPGSEVLSLEPTKDDVSKNKKDHDDDGNDSDGWINVSHSEDELCDSEEEESDSEEESKAEAEEDDSKLKNPMPADSAPAKDAEDGADNSKVEQSGSSDVPDSREKATMVSHSRILSQEEFRKIKVAQLAKQVQFAKGKKRKAGVALSEGTDASKSELVSLKDIEKLHKRPKPDKETRLATAMEGREGREKFGKKKSKKNPRACKTQKQHNKNKAFNMIKHKVRGKKKRSFKDKQIALRNSLLKRKRNQY